MPPNAESSEFLGSLGFRKPITQIVNGRKDAYNWIDGKRINDDVAGYWRIHDKLYDFDNFLKQHPGGSEWLELTKGTDITEAFEAHHIKEIPESLLAKYYVKKAETPRISPLTFKTDDFYMTLKRNVREELKSIPKKAIFISKLYIDLLLLATFSFSILAARYWNYWFAVIAGYCLASLTVAAHNYFHQRNNFRMYYFNFSLMGFKEWRISHSLSHHIYPNSILDIEMIFFEPLIGYYPVNKTFVRKYLSWVYAPLLWFFTFHMALIGRLIIYFSFKDRRIFTVDNFIPFILPLTMYLLGSRSFTDSFQMWNVVMALASFIFSFIGINAAHHHPDIFHDGDTPRKETDWGINQLDSVADRNEITGSHYLILTNFGDHALHHLFPTLDQGMLQYLYPVFKRTAKKFNIDIRMTSQLELVKGQFLQMSRTTPNPNPPSSVWAKNSL